MQHKTWYIIAALSLLIIVVGTGGFVSQKFCVHDYLKQASFQQPVTVIISSGQSAQEIGKQLEKTGVVDSALAFYLNTILRREAKHLKAGEYTFPDKRNIKTVIAKIVKGEVVQHKLTIPEGTSSKEVQALLLNNDKLTGDLSTPILEGTLLPETYYFTRGMERKVLLNRMQKSLESTVNQLWAQYRSQSQLHSSQDVLILASIVEKETALPSERPHVAAVYLNRLKIGMPLQACPTVRYGLEQLTGTISRGILTKEDLNINTPYNTYLNLGLPPHPICNPGKAAILAVLTPLQTRDLYFVTDGKGGSIFAETLEEHQRNHANWRKIRDANKVEQKE